jgi:DNA-directed RNA polymerase specialized sigma24 family protein
MKTSEIIRDFRDIKEDYKYNPDIMNPEDERVARIKEIINSKLSIVDKTIILLYIDCLSYRKLGKRLGLSHMTCRKEVIRIKNIILNEYGRLQQKG